VKYEASLEQTSFKSTYGLWDFTDSYDTANWVSGGSFSAPFTAKGEAGGRVLMAQNTGASDGSGILICRAEPSLDLSGLSARFTLSVSSETAKSADVSIIFGSGDSRAEFTASVLCNAETALVCDMSEFAGAGKIDYASVIIRGGVDADVRVSKVEMCSDTLDSEALEARFYKESADIHRPILYAALVFIAAGTVAVFSALAKKRRRVRKGERNE